MEYNLKIYVVGGDINYTNWIPNAIIVNTIEESDIVFFTGGEDVSPWVYGKKQSRLCYTNEIRDITEIKIFNEAIKLNKFILGVCRGLN